MTDAEFAAHRVQVAVEAERRRTLAEAPAIVQDVQEAVAAALGRQPGDEWVQPLGAHDAYPLGWEVTYDGKLWTSTTPWNTWTPGVSGWRENATDAGPAEWRQPTGAHDAYHLGDRVTHLGQVWECTAGDGAGVNSWEPGVYGWTVIP